MTRPLALLSLAALSIASASAEESATERIRFERGRSEAIVAGKLTGRQDVLYKLDARAGQFLFVEMLPGVKGADFNIFIPGRGPGEEALFNSMVGGRKYVGQLYKSGDHPILVYQNPAAARRGDSTEYRMLVRVTDTKPGDTHPGAGGEREFRKEVSYGTTKFLVTSPMADSGSTFTITPSGLTQSNEPVTVKAAGKVMDVLTDDIDGDNSPEVAVITEEPEEQRRKAHVFTTFAGKSFGMVSLPEVRDPGLLAGYAGGDEFAFVENAFIRRFPLFEDGEKTGTTRQLQYKLEPGEAMKQLVLARHLDY